MQTVDQFLLQSSPKGGIVCRNVDFTHSCFGSSLKQNHTLFFTKAFLFTIPLCLLSLSAPPLWLHYLSGITLFFSLSPIVFMVYLSDKGLSGPTQPSLFCYVFHVCVCCCIMCTFISVTLAQMSLLIVLLSALICFLVNVSPFAILGISDNAHCVYTNVSLHVDYLHIPIPMPVSLLFVHISYMIW